MWGGNQGSKTGCTLFIAQGYVCKPKAQNILKCMRTYHVHPQVNGGLRTFEDTQVTKCGGIEASYWKGYDTRGYRPYIAEIYPS